jgi:hypothetical protein
MEKAFDFIPQYQIMDFEISPGQVKSLQKGGEIFTLLDVREGWEPRRPHYRYVPSRSALVDGH